MCGVFGSELSDFLSRVPYDRFGLGFPTALSERRFFFSFFFACVDSLWCIEPLPLS